MAIAISLVLAVTYILYRYQDAEVPDEPVEDAADSDAAPQAPPVAESSRESSGISTGGGFSTGSTLGEVYSVQGVPTLTQGDTWYYGRSEIRFNHGKVASWEEHPENPLRIDRQHELLVQERFFGVGSTKDEVRAIQGSPITETETVWNYAPSKVYFEHNRVTRWEESPMQSLRVAR
ncbi:MAG: hypothetical protein WBM28_04435 [Burkholderiales bacterium]